MIKVDSLRALFQTNRILWEIIFISIKTKELRMTIHLSACYYILLLKCEGIVQGYWRYEEDIKKAQKLMNKRHLWLYYQTTINVGWSSFSSRVISSAIGEIHWYSSVDAVQSNAKHTSSNAWPYSEFDSMLQEQWQSAKNLLTPKETILHMYTFGWQKSVQSVVKILQPENNFIVCIVVFYIIIIQGPGVLAFL